MIRYALALVVLVAGAAPAQTFELVGEPYRAAASAGAVGAVTGRVYEERRRPEGIERPFVGAAVTLLPRSAEFLKRLEETKQTARSSVHAFRAVAPQILALRASYERSLWESGFADLVRATVVDAHGRFSVADVPAGDWVLVASHSLPSESRPSRTSKQRGTYAPGTRLTGYQPVTVWLREVKVESRRSTSVDLTERGAWFSGVVEDRAPDAGR